MAEFKNHNHNMTQLFAIVLVVFFSVTCTSENKEEIPADSIVNDGMVPAGAVDLGIVMTREDGSTYNLYWAKSNLSEDGLCPNPEDYGDYYAWGETEPHYVKGHSQDNPCSDWRVIDQKTMTGYNLASYKWRNGSYGSNNIYTKYNNIASYGTVDNKTILEDVDDVAHVKLNGKWRTPTYAEWTALRTKCSWTWTSNYNRTGVSGRIVTSNVEGYKDKSIFLPAAGFRDETDLAYLGSLGNYWASSLYTDVPTSGWDVNFDSSNVNWNTGNPREIGQSVRPVSE